MRCDAKQPPARAGALFFVNKNAVFYTRKEKIKRKEKNGQEKKNKKKREKTMLTINYDRDEFRQGESKYGNEFQIQVNQERLNEPYYNKLVLKAMAELKKKTTKHRKENTIVYHNKRQEKIDRNNRVVLTIRHTESGIEPRQPYNKWLVKIIKQNEKERKELASIATALGV